MSGLCHVYRQLEDGWKGTAFAEVKVTYFVNNRVTGKRPHEMSSIGCSFLGT